MYTETEKLIQQEFKFSKILGIPCNEETKHALVSLSQADAIFKDSTNLQDIQKQNPDESDEKSKKKSIFN